VHRVLLVRFFLSVRLCGKASLSAAVMLAFPSGCCKLRRFTPAP
jgi:hypothetical protein